jgi:CRP-like cAMP-binding protein
VAQHNTNSHRNRLLAALSPRDFKLLSPHLESLSLEVRHSIEQRNKPIKHVYFMEEGITSVVAVGDDGKEIEVGLIGREGMTGIVVVMGNHQSPHSVYVQVRGHAQRMGAAEFRKALGASKTLRTLLLKFAQSFMVQTAHTAIANGRANVEQRLARWVLMARDRVDYDELPLTHEFLSLMLGVRRAGVTVALNELEERAVIKANRGHVKVLDRKGLEQIAQGYYGVPEAELRRLMA